ncbi:hypothetical protein AtEden1_Chr1g0039941 [Arabidopsis thaliana]
MGTMDQSESLRLLRSTLSTHFWFSRISQNLFLSLLRHAHNRPQRPAYRGPIAYTTASSYLSSHRQYNPLSSSPKLYFIASSYPRFKSLTCLANLHNRKKIEPSSKTVLLNSFTKSFIVSASSAKPKDSSNVNLRKPLAISLVVTSVSSSVYVFLLRLFSLASILNGGRGGGNLGGGGGKFGGGGDGGFWRGLFALAIPVAIANEEH